jgi:hypothetical protein
VEAFKRRFNMDKKTKIVYQKNGNGERYAGLTLTQVAKAMWGAWKKLPSDYKRQVLVDFASDTDEKDDVENHHGLLLQSPFDSPILVTGGYGGYDFGSAELVEAEDKLGYGTDWEDDYPDMTRPEAVLQKSLEGLIWDEWKDEDGLLWCEVKGCIETYLEALPEDELEVINNN